MLLLVQEQLKIQWTMLRQWNTCQCFCTKDAEEAIAKQRLGCYWWERKPLRVYLKGFPFIVGDYS
jgi:hypothetical protein